MKLATRRWSARRPRSPRSRTDSASPVKVAPSTQAGRGCSTQSAVRSGRGTSAAEKAYVGWIKRHPRDLRTEHVARFLTWLAVERKVSASTQNQALGALRFLYRDVLGLSPEGLDQVV